MTHPAGNSLGLQPKKLSTAINGQLEKWATQGVEGHFEQPTPWLTVRACAAASGVVCHALCAAAD